MKTIKDLKQMISEPASKEWFKKHGSKNKALEGKKLNVKHSDEKHLIYRTFKDRGDYGKAHLKSTTITPSKKN